MEAGIPSADSFQPGDMVFAKYSTFPYWPATICYCRQKAHLNKFRVGTDPNKTKFWVQFFNEKSGAFVHLKKLVPFHPRDTSKYLLKAGASFYDKQRTAMDMATQDYYNLHPDEKRTADASGDAADAPADDADPDAEPIDADDAEERDSESVPDVKSSSDDEEKPPPGKKRRSVSKQRNSAKKKKPRTQRPDVSSPEVAPDPEPSVEEDMSDVDEAPTVQAPKRASRGKASAKAEPKTASASHKKSARAKSSAESHNTAAFESKIATLEKSVKMLQADSEEKKSVIDEGKRELATLRSLLSSKSRRVDELERKVAKYKAKLTSTTKVRITLPDVPPDLPADLPPDSERATEEVGLGSLKELLADSEKQFADYEKVVMRAMKADDEVTSEAKKAVKIVQPRCDALREATEAVLKSEQTVADLLRQLYRAKLSPMDIADCAAGRTVKRIARRSKANSQLLSGLASAVSDCWMELITSCEMDPGKHSRVDAESQTKSEPGRTDGGGTSKNDEKTQKVEGDTEEKEGDSGKIVRAPDVIDPETAKNGDELVKLEGSSGKASALDNDGGTAADAKTNGSNRAPNDSEQPEKDDASPSKVEGLSPPVSDEDTGSAQRETGDNNVRPASKQNGKAKATKSNLSGTPGAEVASPKSNGLRGDAPSSGKGSMLVKPQSSSETSKGEEDNLETSTDSRKASPRKAIISDATS